mgnify:FL=1
MKLNNKIYYFGPFVIMGLIFFLSHQPRVMDGLPEITGLDKLLHCIAYFSLAISWITALLKNSVSAAHSKMVILSMLYALSDEFHQTFIPTRSFEVLDLVADAAGILLALKLSRYIQRKIQVDI